MIINLSKANPGPWPQSELGRVDAFSERFLSLLPNSIANFHLAKGTRTTRLALKVGTDKKLTGFCRERRKKTNRTYNSCNNLRLGRGKSVPNEREREKNPSLLSQSSFLAHFQLELLTSLIELPTQCSIPFYKTRNASQFLKPCSVSQYLSQFQHTMLSDESV